MIRSKKCSSIVLNVIVILSNNCCVKHFGIWNEKATDTNKDKYFRFFSIDRRTNIDRHEQLWRRVGFRMKLWEEIWAHCYSFCQQNKENIANKPLSYFYDIFTQSHMSYIIILCFDLIWNFGLKWIIITKQNIWTIMWTDNNKRQKFVLKFDNSKNHFDVLSKNKFENRNCWAFF